MIMTMGLCLAVLGQEILPGSDASLEQAREEAVVIVVARVIKTDFVLGIGAVSYASGVELAHSSVLKGKVTGNELQSLSSRLSGNEAMPVKGDDYIFFINEYKKSLNIHKVLPKTAASLKAVTGEGA